MSGARASVRRPEKDKTRAKSRPAPSDMKINAPRAETARVKARAAASRRKVGVSGVRPGTGKKKCDPCPFRPWFEFSC
jgi:hypothetical protein